MRIADLRPRDRVFVRQVARFLVDGFREREPDAFPPDIFMSKRVAR